MQTTTIERREIEALLNLAKGMLINNALIENQRAVTWAQASIKTLNGLLNGVGKHCADFQDSKGGYYVPASWQGAWSTFPEGIENYSLVKVQEFFVSSGLQIATDDVTNGKLDAFEEPNGSEVAPVDLHNEHGFARAELNNGAGLHGLSSSKTAILSMPQGSGKTTAATQVAALLGCTSVVDEWRPGRPLTQGALHLTNIDVLTGGAA